MSNIYSEMFITRVCVMLGEACDFKCRHCIMKDCHNSIKKVVSQKLISYLQHICDIHPLEPKNRKELVKISFWGGEPLLYFPQIKEIIERVNRPQAEYSIVTNGANLTKEHVDFFNGLKNGVVFLSNDGPQTDKIRDTNMLEHPEFVKLFNSINRRGIDSVIHAYNSDYKVLWNYIENKCGHIPIAHEFLEVNWDMPSDISAINLEQYRNSCIEAAKQCQQDILNGNLESYPFQLFDHSIRDIIELVRKVDKNKTVELYPRCSPYRYSSHIDLAGNMYACHSGFAPLGNVDLGFEEIYTRCQLVVNTQELNNKKGCENCSIVALCKRGCPFVSGEHSGQHNMCEARRIFFNSALDIVESFNQLLTKIEL